MADPGTTSSILMVEEFGRDEVAALRHAISRRAATVGLSEQRLDDFVVAVNEIITNAVRHANGRGRLRLWVADGSLCCEVTDTGDGIPADRIDPPRPPATFIAGGRGIWMARQLCDELTIDTGPRGTRVCMVVTLRPSGPADLLGAPSVV